MKCLMSRAKLEKYLEVCWPKCLPIDPLFRKLPKHYILRRYEAFLRKPIPVHWKPRVERFEINKYGQKMPVVNKPIEPFSPPLAEKGLWGGEQVVYGYKTNRFMRIPYVWVPKIQQKIFYSEILDKHMLIQCTQRTEDLVDQSYGFDHYILNTHEVDLKSKLGLDIKRDMLVKLCYKNISCDPKKNETLYQKYFKYIESNDIQSPNEAEWYGLSLEEAYEKYFEGERVKEETIPLKYIYLKQILDHILNEDSPQGKLLAN